MIDRLIENIKKTNAPICVGLDPKAEFIPDYLKEKCFKEYGVTLKGLSEAIKSFNFGIIDAIYDIIPSVKIQVAMYEELGTDGLDAYIKTAAYAREKGMVVIGDVKRGDIGSTCKAYANAHLGKTVIEYAGEVKEFSTFDTDFATVNPYMGSDGINEFLKNCTEYDRGIFALLKTSNPSGKEFQDLLVDGAPLYEHVAAKIKEWGESSLGQYGYNDVGAVVGATYPEVGAKLRSLMPATYFLVPGYGAQGALGKDLKEYFNKDGLGAIINSSRGIICAYKKDTYSQYAPEEFAQAARAASLDMIEDISNNCFN